VLIQVGPIIAVTLVFWRHILDLLTGWNTPSKRDELTKLAASFLITGVLGFTAKKLGMKLPETLIPIAFATLVGGFVILWAEQRAHKRRLTDTITWGIAIAVGLGQVLAAIFPGTSRSGATVIAALLLGMARPSAVRFAFLVGIPTMFAAGGLQIKEAIKAGQSAVLLAPETLVAFAVATVTAWISVVWLLKFVQSRDFKPFAYYRIALGTLLLCLVASGVMQ